MPLAAPLPYHLPPGADAYPFLKLETYAPFRDTAAKSKPSFGPAVSQSDPAFATSPLLNRSRASGPAPGAVPPVSTPESSSPVIPSHSHSTSHPHSTSQSQAQTQPLPALHPSVPPHCGNFVATTIRAWHVYPPAPGESSSSSAVSDLSIQGSSQAPQPLMPTSTGSTRAFTPNPVHSAPTPPPAPAPRPTRVTSITARAIFAKIVSGGRWGVFVVKRGPGSGSGSTLLGAGTGSDVSSRDKGKQKADSFPLTAEALAHLSQAEVVDRKGKGKAVPIDGERVAQWAGESASGNAASAGGINEVGKNASKSDGEAFLVVHDLDAADGAFEKGRMAEFHLKWTPAGMACRATRSGIVIALVSGMSEGAYTTILRWSYMSSSLTHLGSHKSKCPLGAISIQEYEDGRTLVSIVHRPWTVMIQDVDSGQRCFVKLSKIPPRHTLQAIHLLPGPRLLVLRKIQAADPDNQAYALEEYEIPPAGESVYPAGPVQRQWIRGMDLHGCMLVEGPTFEDGSQPDVALWAFSTLPNRAVVHWVLRARPKTGIGTSDDMAPNTDPGATDESEPLSAVEKDIYADEAVYAFPARRVSTNRLSFPHHKATLAPGARRALWFERPERSRTGEARGMRGVWAYTSVDPYSERGGEEKNTRVPVVRNCTGELPEEVLSAMENNTLGVAFDECSGRALVLTCGDGYGAVNGCRIWVLDYA
ncbi:hypothetical protein FRC08_009869 [Ceratobasidium sp. 394]|nr:hypothetical protein FRC08_009869 [Ceratobasidium sp. 394]